ncbi:MAG: tetratricopeptide repeat protein [Deltaproteobacteria bacterium]|nr:tetratricopeptide repeat protein [Deltaproteobacteria bacterium]
MSENSRAIVAVGQRGVVASVTRQLTITEKLTSRIQAVQALSEQNNSILQTERMSEAEWHKKTEELKAEYLYCEENIPRLLSHALLWTQAMPENADAWYWLGRVYDNSDQRTKAIEAYQRTIRIKPENTYAWNWLGRDYQYTNQQDKAIEAFQQTIHIKPENTFAWHWLGHAYYDSGQLNKAIEAFQEAISIKPENALFWNDLGVAYGLNGQTSQIMEVYKHLKALDPARAEEFYTKFIAPK